MKKINKRFFCIVLLSIICLVVIISYGIIIKHYVIKKQFSKSNVELFKMIGNAVPLHFSKILAQALYELLFKEM